MSVQHVTPVCDRCGAPASPRPGGRLLPLKGFRARHYLHARGRTSSRRVPPGYEHADPEFCRARVPFDVEQHRPRPWDLRRPRGGA